MDLRCSLSFVAFIWFCALFTGSQPHCMLNISGLVSDECSSAVSPFCHITSLCKISDATQVSVLVTKLRFVILYAVAAA